MKLIPRYLIAFVVAMAVYAILQFVAVKVTINSAASLSLEAFRGAFFYLLLVHLLGFSFDAPLEKLTRLRWVGLGCGYFGATILLVAINWTSADNFKILWSAATVSFVFIITFIVSTGAADAFARRISDKESTTAP